MADGLVAFLRARLDEDEQAARAAHYEGQRWISEEEDVCRWPDDELVHIADRKRDAAHIARHDPARVLREVEAKRRILDEHADGAELYWDFHYCRRCEDRSRHDAMDWPCPTLRLLALPYADHDEFREEWKP